MNKTVYLITILILIFSGSVFGQPQREQPLTRILFVFDASNSMAGFWDTDKKIIVARNMLSEMLDSMEHIPNIQMALRVYGHQKPFPPQDCDDTKLEVPFGPSGASKIRQKLKYISPRGTTPIAHTLTKCAGDFPACENCRNIIILITDGVEECEGDPCEASLMLQKKGVILKPFVIGVGLDIEFHKTFECVGEFYNAENESQFRNFLNVIITQAINTTSVQVNLLDNNSKPTETDVNMTFFDRTSGKMIYNYMHTINSRGIPDTVSLDPLISYRMVAHTIPPVSIDSISLIAGKHTVVATDAPQGFLEIKNGNRGVYNPTKIIVRQKGIMETLNVQNVTDVEKYITGLYDLEILTLPRMYLYDIEVKQSHTTTVEIPRPGTLTIQKAASYVGSLYTIDNGKIEWVANLKEVAMREILTLQPGNYRLIYRAKHADQSIYTYQKSFRILSGGSELLRF